MGMGQSASADVTSMEEHSWIKDRIVAHPVVVFSKTTCGYCRQAKKLLDTNQISYQVHELNHMQNAGKIQDVLHHMTGARTVCTMLFILYIFNNQNTSKKNQRYTKISQIVISFNRKKRMHLWMQLSTLLNVTVDKNVVICIRL